MPPRKTPATQGPDAKKTTTARGAKLQKLDGDAQPVGDPQPLGEVALSFEPDDSDIQLPEPGATMEFETSDPAAVAAVQEATRIPIPTAVVNKWWPAFFRGPGTEPPWATCKVFLTPQGLYVYRAVPEDETFATGALPAWYAPADFAKTAKPVTGYAAMNAGIPIITTAGTVTVQPAPGCGCAAGRLKRWTPSWVRNTISWEDAVALTGATDATAGR